MSITHRALVTVPVLATLALVGCSSNDQPEPQASATSHLEDNAEVDAEFVCEASCSLAAGAACVYGVEPACDAEVYCEAICAGLTTDQKNELICVRVSDREEICCQTAWGCQNEVDTSCKTGSC